jgi:outer membrane receptor for ferrienterochelin and colicin
MNEGGDMFDANKVLKGFVIFAVIIVLICPLSLGADSGSEDEQEEKSEKQKKIDRLFKMSLEELMDVRITTAGKTSERIGDIPASVVLITREDIETYGYRTLTEILDNIPGLYSIDDYAEGGANFGVRGFWSGQRNDNMIILVNDVHQVNDFLSNYPLDKIDLPVEAIDRIEVIRGPMSVVYGNGAFYGVINIITNEDIMKPVSIISGSWGSLNTKKLFVRMAGNKDDFKYVFNSSIYQTDGIDQPLIEMVSDPSALLSLGAPADSRTGGRMAKNGKYFNFSGEFKGFFVDMSYNEGKKEFYFALPSVADGSRDNSSTTHISFGFRKKFSEKFRLEGKASYTRSRDNFKYDHLFEGFYGIEMLESNAWEGEANAFFNPTKKIDITAGLYYRAILNATDMYDLPSFGIPLLENTTLSLAEGDDIVTRALYSQITYSPVKSLRLVAGVRLEQSPKYGLVSNQTVGGNLPIVNSGTYSRDNIEFIPRLAALLYLNENNVFKFLYGEAINRPSFAQNAQNALNSAYPVLQPESIQTVELNYISTFSSRFSLNASVFRNTLKNLITRVVRIDDAGNYESFSDNAVKMVTNGAELTINTEPIEYLRVELSGTYQDTKDKTQGYENIAAAYSPKFLGYLKASFLGVGFKISLTGTYVGPMETFWDKALQNPDGSIGEGRIGDRVDGYFIMGANLRVDDLFVDGVFLNIKCSNLFDEDIRYPTFTNNPWAARGTLGFGRSFLVSLGYKF